MNQETFTKVFLDIFSIDTEIAVTLKDTPSGLDLDSLDVLELGLEFEDTFDIENVDTLDLVSFLKKPLFMLRDALYGVYCLDTKGLNRLS